MSRETTGSFPLVTMTTQEQRDAALRNSLRFDKFDESVEEVGCGTEFPLFPPGEKTLIHYSPDFNVGWFSSERFIELPNAKVKLHIQVIPAIAGEGFTPLSPVDNAGQSLRNLYYPEDVRESLKNGDRVTDLKEAMAPLAFRMGTKRFSFLKDYSLGIYLPGTNMRFVLQSLWDEPKPDIRGSHSEFVDATDSQTYTQVLRDEERYRGGVFVPSDREVLSYWRGFVVSNKEIVRNTLLGRPIDTP